MPVYVAHTLTLVLPDSASSAVRNLNDYEIMNRKLRVDFSKDGGDDETVGHLFPSTIAIY